MKILYLTSIILLKEYLAETAINTVPEEVRERLHNKRYAKGIFIDHKILLQKIDFKEITKSLLSRILQKLNHLNKVRVLTGHIQCFKLHRLHFGKQFLVIFTNDLSYLRSSN